MRPDEAIVTLRTMDPALRRYATHMAGNNAGSVLYNAYVAAATDGSLDLHGDQRLVHMLRVVHGNGAAFAVRSGASDAGQDSSDQTPETSTAGVDSWPTDLLQPELDPPSIGDRPQVEAALDSQAEPEDPLIDRLGQVLIELSIGERGALLLTVLEGRTPDQAAEVLGTSTTTVADWIAAAARMVGAAVPELDSADPVALHRALGDLPVPQAHPDFWVEVEGALPLGEPPPVEATTAMRVPTLYEPEPSAWPKYVGAGLIIAIVVGAIGLLAWVNDEDPDDVAAGSPTTVLPTVTVSTNPDVPEPSSPTTAVEETTSVAPSTTVALTSTTEEATTTEVQQTTQPTTPPSSDPTGGLILRGAIPFAAGRTTAALAGQLPPDHTDNWELTTVGPVHLAVGTRAVEGANAIDPFVSGPDGRLVELVFSNESLLVYFLPAAGVHLLGVSAPFGTTSSSAYEISVAVSAESSGFVWVEDERESLAEGMRLSACQRTNQLLSAGLVYESDDDQLVDVTEADGADDNAIRWSGPLQAVASVEASTSIEGGVILSGLIEQGPDGLIGRTAVAGVYGCPDPD